MGENGRNRGGGDRKEMNKEMKRRPVHAGEAVDEQGLAVLLWGA